MSLCLQYIEDRETIPNKGTSLFPSLPDFEITTQGVEYIIHILSNCNPYKSPGPDYIHPYALKATAAEISPMLTHIFQQSLDSGTVPTSWKHAYVTLVFKKGSISDPKNYHLFLVVSNKSWLMGLYHLLVKLHQVFLRAVSLALYI